jgi:hypothetical protein
MSRSRFRQTHPLARLRPRYQVEWCWALDADQFPRPIRAGASGELDLTTRDGRHPIELRYIIRNIGEFVVDAWLPSTPANAHMRFNLDPSPLRFGGARTYLGCPGCGARSLKLYLPFYSRDGFACRECYGLAYRSSSVRRRSVAQLRADVARLRASVERPLPRLPSPEAEWTRFERRARAASRRTRPPDLHQN